MNAERDFFENANKPPADDDVEEISDAEFHERLERLRTMGRMIGDDCAMRVVVGKERGWRYKFKPVNTIEVDAKDLRTKGFEYCAGLIAHEGAHRRISRVGFIPKEVWQRTGFSFLINAIEDPRVNDWAAEQYAGARDWLQQVYDTDIATEEKIEEVSREKLGYVPKHIQYDLEIIRQWHTGTFSRDLPDDVREVLFKTVNDAKAAYGEVPARDADEREITERAQAMYTRVYAKIWPEHKKLVDEALDEEMLRQMVQDMAERGELELPPEAVREQEGDGDGGSREDKDTAQDEYTPAETGPESEDKGEDEDGEREAPQIKPLSELPHYVRKELEKRIREILDSMPDDARDARLADAEGKAQKILDDLEADLDREIRGRFSDQPETKAEERRRREREEDEASKKEKSAAEARNAREQFDRKREAEKTDYDRAYEEVQEYIDRVADIIANLLIKKRFPQFRKSFPGQTLRLKGAMKYEGTKDYRELYERRLPVERKDYTFLLLVDLSGSMSGKKIDETFKGVVLFAEALERVSSTLGSVKVAVYGFQDKLIEYKTFGEAMSDAVRQDMSVMKKEVDNKGRHNQKSFNNDGYCVDTAAEILRGEPGKEKFMFVLSDGQPEGDREIRVDRYRELSQDDELMRVVDDISRTGDMRLLGIGLGSGTDHVARFYRDELPNVEHIANVPLQKLVDELAKKLEDLIK